MPDDPTKKNPQDAAEISLKEKHEVEYWTKHFGVTRQQLEEAVKKAGHSVKAVAGHLKKN